MEKSDLKRAGELLNRMEQPFWSAVFNRPASPATTWSGGASEGRSVRFAGLRMRLRDMTVVTLLTILLLLMAAWIFIYSQKVMDHDFGQGPIRGLSTFGGE